jgi:hypothetical protein
VKHVTQWKKQGYLIVSEGTLKQLQETVNEHLQKGWKVEGPRLRMDSGDNVLFVNPIPALVV